MKVHQQIVKCTEIGLADYRIQGVIRHFSPLLYLSFAYFAARITTRLTEICSWRAKNLPVRLSLAGSSLEGERV